jgi:hypothetical protein
METQAWLWQWRCRGSVNFVIATGGGEKMHGSSLDDVDRHTRFREEASHQPPHNQRPVWNIFDHDPAVFSAP